MIPCLWFRSLVARLAVALGCGALSAMLAFASAPAFADETGNALAERVARLRAGERIRAAGEPIVARDAVAEFFSRRGFGPAWSDDVQRAGLLAAVERSVEHGLSPGDYHATRLRELVLAGPAEPGSAGDRDAAVDRELLFTDALVRLASHLRFGKVNPRALHPEWNFSAPVRGAAAVVALEELLAAGRVSERLESLAPRLPLYDHMRAALARHRAIESSGGWPNVTPGRKLEAGVRDARVRELRARLAAGGDLRMHGAVPDEFLFDETLRDAVTAFQIRHGLEPDGKVGRRTLEALNVPVGARIEQLRVNLERLRWVAQDLAEDYLLVDIAGYTARLSLGGRIVWTGRVVVGKPYRHTPAFRATMEQIVLNPSWVVPPTILREDVLPKIAKDPSYLARNAMRVFDRGGRPVDASAIDWSHGDSKASSYRIVQAPGPTNPLGDIKFVLPNPYAVYLHDTPSRLLFERARRAFSSGCIRVEQPHQLAALLLDDPEQASVEALKRLIATKATRTLPVRHAVPVMLLYFTAEADESGIAQFRDDLYARDARVAAALRVRAAR